MPSKLPFFCVISSIGRPPPTTNLWTKDYEILFLKKPRETKNLKIIGLIREKDESLILEDTLNELSKIVDGFIMLDDCSSDNSIDIAKKFPKCLAVIKHLTHVKGDRSMEESIHRELLLDLAKKYRPSWIFYQDADERIENPLDFREFMLDNINSKISGIRLSLFDAYMTEADKKPYISGPLYNFRKMFGPERRDIIMAWKNSPDITFMVAADLREPQGIKAENIVTNFFVQHYGKALSEKQWEETCDYYIKHFPQYAEKWRARKGKAIHKNKSDFGRTLESWESVKKSGGVKIN